MWPSVQTLVLLLRMIIDVEPHTSNDTQKDLSPVMTTDTTPLILVVEDVEE